MAFTTILVVVGVMEFWCMIGFSLFLTRAWLIACIVGDIVGLTLILCYLVWALWVVEEENEEIFRQPRNNRRQRRRFLS